MNGGDSGMVSGTSGSPQLSFENYEYENKMKELEDLINNEGVSLTPAQLSRLQTLKNTIQNHLTEGDYKGTLRDLQGNPVPNGRGGFFDHVSEMKNSYKALLKIQRGLKGSLSNPNLSPEDRMTIIRALGDAERHIDMIRELFNPYGGIK